MFPTRQNFPPQGNSGNSGHAKHGLSDGAIAGIVIAVLAVVAALLYYLYRTQHLQYAKRFIKIPAFSLYSFLPDDSIYHSKVKSKKKGSTTISIDEDHVIVTNPMVSSSKSFENSLELTGITVERHNSSFSDSTPRDPNDDANGENIVNVSLINVVKSGYLMKKSVSMKRNWLKRWFFIKDGQLFYTHTHSSMMKDSTIYAVLVANLVISTVRTSSSSGKTSTSTHSTSSSASREFQIVSPGQRGLGHGGGVYELMAETEEEATSWIQVIRNQIEGSLTKTLDATLTKVDTGYSSVSAAQLLVPSEIIIRELKAINPTCVDCGATGPEWASLNLCVMMCIDCSGVHRNMGSHVSKVRSIKLDKWSSVSIELMKEVGNSQSNRMIWESKFYRQQVPRPILTSREDKDRFIRDKYVGKAFLEPCISTSSSKQSTLYFLSAADKGDVLKLLACIAAGVDVNAVIERGDSPVDKKIAAEFVGRTALSICCRRGHKLCVELLVQNNARVDLMDNDGLTPLDIAMIENNQQVIEIIASQQRK